MGDKPIKEYCIVSGEDIGALDCFVNARIRGGWEPIGGPFSKMHNGNTLRFYQAMIIRGYRYD